nr:hypothetical protein [Tanacetum cinerariifolium]
VPGESDLMTGKEKKCIVLRSNGAYGIPGQMTHFIAGLTLDSAKSYVMQGASYTQRKVSSIPFVFSIPFVLSRGGSISPDSFLSFILLLVVMVVAIIRVVIVVTIIGIVVAVVGAPSIIKLTFVITVTVPSMLWGNPSMKTSIIFSMLAACASRAAATLSATSCRIAAWVIAGAINVDVLLGAILSTITRQHKIRIHIIVKIVDMIENFRINTLTSIRLIRFFGDLFTSQRFTCKELFIAKDDESVIEKEVDAAQVQMDKCLKEVLMIDCLSIVETDKVIHTAKTNIVKLVVKIESFGMNSDEFDTETGPSDGLQPKQVDLSCVHALNEVHLHERWEKEKNMRTNGLHIKEVMEEAFNIKEEFLESKEGWGWRGVKEKQQGLTNDNVKETFNVIVVDEPILRCDMGKHLIPTSYAATPNECDALINVTDSPSTAPISAPISFAKLVTSETSRKSLNFGTLVTTAGNEADVVVPLESRAISERFVNMAHGFFLGKQVAYPVVANYFSSMDSLDSMLENGLIKRYIDTKPNHELIHYCLENPPYKLDWKDVEVLVSEGSPITTTARIRETYKNISQDIRDQLNAEAEVVQIILTGIDNDIYSTVDACLNACEMWKAIKRLKQGESINVQDLETNLYSEFGKFTSQDGESLKLYYSRLYKMMNELIRNQCKVTNHQVNVQGKTIVNFPQPIYDQEPSMVAEDDETSKDKEIDKLMALISLSFKKIYKPTNNNLRTSSNTSRTNQDNSPRINKSAGYDNQRNGNVAEARETVGSSVVQKSRIQYDNCKEFRHVARECQKPKRVKDAAYHRETMLFCKQEEAIIQLNTEQADWRDDTDDDELEDQELEAHYMYMAQLQEVSPDVADSVPIFDDEPLQKVSNDDYYNVFAMESTHTEQSKSVHDTYPIEQDTQNVIIDSLDMNCDREEIDQNDDDDDLAKERELLAFLIEKLKCEIDESKNRNKFLETSNKALIEKLKGEIEDFKNKNKSLESSNNFFKEANNKLSETNNLLYANYKKSEAELARCNSKEYALQLELECAKVRGDLLSYKMDYHKSCTKYTDTINALNQTISEMKDKLSANQETISILSKQKEAQIKLYKTQEDKELDKVIQLENKVNV